MIRRLTPLAVLLAAVLVMGAGVAKAQETEVFAVPSSVNLLIGGSAFVVVTGVVNGTEDFTGAGTLFSFSLDEPVIKAVNVNPGNLRFRADAERVLGITGASSSEIHGDPNGRRGELTPPGDN